MLHLLTEQRGNSMRPFAASTVIGKCFVASLNAPNRRLLSSAEGIAAANFAVNKRLVPRPGVEPGWTVAAVDHRLTMQQCLRIKLR